MKKEDKINIIELSHRFNVLQSNLIK